jgi:nitrate/TMAO reductase-like tetraheme cytochrome c subunit
VRTRRLLVASVIVWALALGYSVRALPNPAPTISALQQPAAAPPVAAPAAPANADCLTCHEDDAAARADGSKVVVKPAIFDASIHGGLSCVDCHQDLATAELPHPEKLQKVECSTCHADAAELMKISVHAKVRADGAPGPTCASCHGTHDIRPKTDPASRSHHLNIAETCASCHGNQELIAKGIVPVDVTKSFADSIHGTVLAKSGLMVAPTCSSCHGAHDIRSPSDPASRVAKTNVETTCGTCHEGIARQFHGGVHAAMLLQGNTGAPACQTCHTAHGIQRSDKESWQLSVINQCGTCHADRLATFRDTFHGQVTALGSRSVAGCADCHGAHEVLPASDPRSPIAPANLVKTCGKCHENATANFVKYDPHADKHNFDRNPALYFTAKFMTLLLAGVFGFFGIHTALWFGKEYRLKRERPRKGAK